MTLSDILDGSFRLMKANARSLLTIVAVFVVPLQVLGAWAQRGIFGGAGFFDIVNDPSVLDAGAESSQFGGTAAAWVASGLNLFLLPFVAGAVSQVVAASYLGRQLGAGAALRATARRAWSLFWGWVLVHLLEASGVIVAVILVVVLAAVGATVVAVLAGIAGFFLSVGTLLGVMALSVAVSPAIVVEDLGAVAGVRRSWRLMRPRFWPVLGIALLGGLVASMVGQVLGFVPSMLAFGIGLEYGWILLALGSILSAVVSIPLVAIIATLQYFDARIRTEGFDLEMIAAGLAAERGPG